MDNDTGPGEIRINSFVFLDLETSHLEKGDRPTIIEMSLFAVHRTGLLHPDVLASVNRAKRQDTTYDLSKVLFPRVVDKLTLCLDPRKQTSAQSFCLTKLDNLNLCESKKMALDKDVISMLNIFLRRQEGPICLVAHNGNRFDFPMLRTELSRVTANEPFEDFLCADSLDGFRDNFASEVKQVEDPGFLKRKNPEREGSNLPAKRGTDMSDTIPTIHTSSNAAFPSSDHAAVADNGDDKVNDRSTSDNTPDRTLAKRPSPPPPPRKISYSLINIFKRTFGREPPISHSAEDDVASLIKVLQPRMEEFVKWADVRAVQYKNIDYYYKPLKPRRKLFDD
ncbi:three prime repair exonuclease 2-like [Lytechinus pictus]|uniref:three prime repair exonuclease 2-like n=1 Tax=Lytechinus pictus TaxID=7653 RepID=UPI0030BA0607